MLGFSFEALLRFLLLGLVVFFLIINYSSYARLSHRRERRTANLTNVVRQIHVNWKRTSRDPFQTEEHATSSPPKGLIEEFIDLVAPDEVIPVNKTDELAVENAVSLERDG